MNPIESLIERGRRRVLWQLFLDKACLALTIFMGGALVLLLVGTQILDWYWLVLLALGGLGAGLYQLRGKVPSSYRVAQHIDRQSHLDDSLSTAFYFGGNPDPGRDALVRLQRERAEEIVPQVNLKSALPYTRSRYLLPAGVLAAVAIALFVLRYAVTGSLDLNGSLVALAADSFFSSPTEIAKSDGKKGSVNAKDGETTAPEDQGKNDKKEEDALPESMMEPENEANPQAQSDDKGDQQDKQDKGKQDQEQGNDSSKSKQDESQDANNSDQPGNQDSKDGKQSNQKNEPSALDKLRDALANLMNKNKSDAANKGQDQNKQKGQAQKAEDGEKQQSQQGGDSSSQEQGAQQDKNAQQQNNAKGGESQQKNPEASSSQGDKIGDKALKNVEALQAMGKISELMGKRAENVKGEVMIEVGQTKQQLKTAWSSQNAAHAEAGSEIHRDEVPLMYQQYVEQYFEALRKTPEGGARIPKPAPKPQAAPANGKSN